MALRSGVLAALAMLLATAAPAAAATHARVEGDTLYIETAAGQVNEIYASFNRQEDSCGNPFSNPCGAIEVYDLEDGTTHGAGCVGTPTVHICGGPSTVNVVTTLGEGDDQYGGGADRNHRVTAGPGNDRLFLGGGADNVDLGEGDDFARPGLGTDTIVGGDGNDEIDAIGFRLEPDADTINCGPGNDRVLADIADTIDPSCERVLMGQTGPPMAVDLPAKLKVGGFLKKGLAIDVEVAEGCDIGAALRLTKATAKKFKVVRGVATAKGKVTDRFDGGTATLRLKTTKKIAAKLAGAKRLKGELEVICKTGRGRTVSLESLTFKR